eukprot:6814388-Prymnesium_polylepis.1
MSRRDRFNFKHACLTAIARFENAFLSVEHGATCTFISVCPKIRETALGGRAKGLGDGARCDHPLTFRFALCSGAQRDVHRDVRRWDDSRPAGGKRLFRKF